MRRFDQLTAEMETGDPEPLRLAAMLKPASDASFSLSLNYAVARAIPETPEAVLGLVGGGFTLDDLCTSPFIEPDPGVAERYERRAIAALATVRGELASLARPCAERIRLPLR